MEDWNLMISVVQSNVNEYKLAGLNLVQKIYYHLTVDGHIFGFSVQILQNNWSFWSFSAVYAYLGQTEGLGVNWYLSSANRVGGQMEVNDNSDKTSSESK